RELDLLEHVRRRLAHRDVVRVVAIHAVKRLEHAERGGDIRRVEARGRPVGRRQLVGRRAGGGVMRGGKHRPVYRTGASAGGSTGCPSSTTPRPPGIPTPPSTRSPPGRPSAG